MPAGPEKRSLAPGVEPMSSQYWRTPWPPSQANVTVLPGSVEPGTGAVRWAGTAEAG